MKYVKMLIYAALIILIPVIFSGMETIDGRKHLIIATDATWPPMEMVNQNHEIEGFDIDLLEAAAKAEGFTVEFRNVPWDEIFVQLDSGSCDAIISAITITDERKTKMDFSVPYINAGQVLVVRSDMKEVKHLSDLEGKSVGAQIGTSGGFVAEKNKGITLRTYDDLEHAMRDLVNNTIDGVVCDMPVAANYASHNADYKNKLTIATAPLTEEYYGIAVKKGNTKVLNLINAGLKKILETETYTDIEKKWLR